MLDLKLKNKKFFYGTISILFTFFLFPGQAQAANCDCFGRIQVSGTSSCQASAILTFTLDATLASHPQEVILETLKNSTASSCGLLATDINTFEIDMAGTTPAIANITQSNCVGYTFAAGNLRVRTLTVNTYTVNCTENVGAATGENVPPPTEPVITCPSGLKVTNEALCVRSELMQLNKLGGNISVAELIGRVIRTVMGVVGSIALAMLVVGGLIWMTARGNSERVATAMRTITWATLGIIVILSSYIIVKFIFGIF